MLTPMACWSTRLSTPTAPSTTCPSPSKGSCGHLHHLERGVQRSSVAWSPAAARLGWKRWPASLGPERNAWSSATAGSATAGPRSLRWGPSLVQHGLEGRGPSRPQEAFAPCPIDEVVATIAAERPDVVFAPHVETSAGLMLPDDYIAALPTRSTRSAGCCSGLHRLGNHVGGHGATGVDVLLSAPQKGWSGSPCSGLVMMSGGPGPHRGHHQHQLRRGSLEVAANHGGLRSRRPRLPRHHAHRRPHAFRTVMDEAKAYGFDKLKVRQQELGSKIRAVLESHGFPSVAAAGFQLPGRGVLHRRPRHQVGQQVRRAGHPDCWRGPAAMRRGRRLLDLPLGLFGLDKLQNVDRTVASFADSPRNPVMDIKPITGALGAEVRGVDLSLPRTSRLRRLPKKSKQAFADHLVLAFRDQHLTVDQQEAFTLQLGRLRAQSVRRRHWPRPPQRDPGRQGSLREGQLWRECGTATGASSRRLRPSRS